MNNMHGLSRTRIYKLYHRMVYRCRNDKTCETYKDYRKNGIKVCDEWLGKDGFIHFYKWSMYNGYSDDLTLDRIDGSKGYSPENCRWATWKTQANNTNRNRMITYNGKTQTMSKWADELGIPYQRLNTRINALKMPIEYAFIKEKMNNGTRKNGVFHTDLDRCNPRIEVIIEEVEVQDE